MGESVSCLEGQKLAQKSGDAEGVPASMLPFSGHSGLGHAFPAASAARETAQLKGPFSLSPPPRGSVQTQCELSSLCGWP